MSASVGQSEGRSLADQSLNVQCFPSDKCTSSAAMLEAIPGQLCFDCTTTMKATLSYRNTIGSTIETAAGFRGERTTSGTSMHTVMRAIAPRHAIKGPINCSVSPPRRMWDPSEFGESPAQWTDYWQLLDMSGGISRIGRARHQENLAARRERGHLMQS